MRFKPSLCFYSLSNHFTVWEIHVITPHNLAAEAILVALRRKQSYPLLNGIISRELFTLSS